MSRIGRPNPLDRVVRAVRGWLRPEDPPRGPKPALLPIAHRGAAREAPENTIGAFRKAVAQGAAGIETDVCATRDGRFVLFHDARPDGKVALVRQTVGEGANLRWAPAVPDLFSRWRRPICELDYEDVLRHYGYRRGGRGLLERLRDGKPEVPPARLEDLFGWIGRNPGLSVVLLDLKLETSQADAAVRLHRRIADLVRSGRLPPSVPFHFLSVHTEIVEALLAETRRGAPESLRVSPDFEYPGVLDFARRSGARDVSMGCGQRAWADFRDELTEVVEARDRGELDSVIAWTIDAGQQLSELAARGVDGIVTNDVPKLRKILSLTAQDTKFQ
ncbi:MAG TPA: glycerophosphodiester phosphodiesterase [Thermoanaerobaculia bacterium]|nr:glycerophosphodiester phosphodiesterase [Thermoanaerobaculia bacterium]